MLTLPGHTYHGDFIYGWDKSMEYEIVRDTYNYVEAKESIGGEEALNQTAECMQLNEEEKDWAKEADWAAMERAFAGENIVELGVYDKHLTITDGKSINATWSGKWGEEGIAVNQSASNSTNDALLETISVSTDAEDSAQSSIPETTSVLPCSTASLV